MWAHTRYRRGDQRGYQRSYQSTYYQRGNRPGLSARLSARLSAPLSAQVQTTCTRHTHARAPHMQLTRPPLLALRRHRPGYRRGHRRRYRRRYRRGYRRGYRHRYRHRYRPGYWSNRRSCARTLISCTHARYARTSFSPTRKRAVRVADWLLRGYRRSYRCTARIGVRAVPHAVRAATRFPEMCFVSRVRDFFVWRVAEAIGESGPCDRLSGRAGRVIGYQSRGGV